jgi:hypothetical protein
MRLFGKPYKELNAGELEEFREEMMRLMNKFMAKGGRVEYHKQAVLQNQESCHQNLLKQHKEHF